MRQFFCLLLPQDEVSTGRQRYEEARSGVAGTAAVQQRMVMNHLPAFPPTQWTRLERDGGSAAGREWFCETYRPAVLAYLRGRCGPDEAEDLCQEFFCSVVLARDLPSRADRERGSMRALLRSALRNFLVNRQRSQRAQKRGGGAQNVPLDDHPSTSPYLADARAEAPDRAFDKAWATHLLQRAMAETEAVCGKRGKTDLFQALLPALEGTGPVRTHAEIAAALGLKIRDITQSLSRLRQMVGKHLYEQVSLTVAGTENLDAEWAAVREALEEN